MNTRPNDFDFETPEPNATILKFNDDDDICDIIDQNDILSECRFHNPTVIEFFSKPKTILKVIDLIVKAPVLSLPIKLQYKYSHFATELFLLQCEPILRSFHSDRINLEILYNFLQSKSSISFITIGQIRSIFCNIAQYNKESFIFFLKEKNDFINIILTHIDKTSTIDLVFDLIKIYEGQSEGYENEFLSYIINRNIILQMLNHYSETEDEEIRFTCIQFLSGLLLFSRMCLTHITYSNSSLTKFRIDLNRCISDLESDWLVNSLLEVGFKCEADDTLLIPAIFYMRTLLDTSINVESGFQIPLLVKDTSVFDIMTETNSDLDFAKTKNLIEKVLSCITPFVERICDRLIPKLDEKDPNHYGLERIFILRNLIFFLHTGLSNYIGKRQDNLNISGFRRNSFSNTLDNESQQNCIETFLEKLIEYQFFPKIIEQMFLYPWNSFLHASVENLIEILINSSICVLGQSKTDVNFNEKSSLQVEENNNLSRHLNSLEDQFKRVLQQVLTEGGLMVKILAEWDKNKAIVSQGGKNAGFTGQLRNLCNLLQASLIQRYYESLEFVKDEKALKKSTGEDNLQITKRKKVDPIVEVFASMENLDKFLVDWNNLFNGDIIAGNEIVAVSYHILTESELASDQENDIQDEDEDMYGTFIQKIFIDENSQKEFEKYCSEIEENKFPSIFGVSEDEFILAHNRADFEMDYRLNRVTFDKQKNEEFKNCLFEVACNEMIKYKHNGEIINDKEFKNIPIDDQSLDENTNTDLKNDCDFKSEKENETEEPVSWSKSQMKKTKKKSIPIRILNEVFSSKEKTQSDVINDRDPEKAQKKSPSLQNVLKSSVKLELVQPDEDQLKSPSGNRKVCESDYDQVPEDTPGNLAPSENNYLPKDFEKQKLLIKNTNRLYTTRLSHHITQKNSVSKVDWNPEEGSQPTSNGPSTLAANQTRTNPDTTPSLHSYNPSPNLVLSSAPCENLDDVPQATKIPQNTFNSKKILRINQVIK